MPLLVLAALLFSTPVTAEEVRISNCGEPSIEAEWRELIDAMGEISVAERRDAIAVNRKRHEICRQVENGDLTLDEGISTFEAERRRWQERTRMRKRIDASEFVTG